MVWLSLVTEFVVLDVLAIMLSKEFYILNLRELYPTFVFQN